MNFGKAELDGSCAAFDAVYETIVARYHGSMRRAEFEWTTRRTRHRRVAALRRYSVYKSRIDAKYISARAS